MSAELSYVFLLFGLFVVPRTLLDPFHHLVGAFLVGMAAQRLRDGLPALASKRMRHSVESFASSFVQCYFLHAGLPIRGED
jgi:hypothetical protein